jgi:threonyl-tRNA synthetase
MPKNHVIKITSSNTGNGHLTLSDRGKTDVEPKDTVTWIIEKHSGVKEIKNIFNKPTSVNVFDPKPGTVGNSSNWKGTIDPGITEDEVEDYNIEWIDEEGKSHTYDPKIQVHIRDR